MATVAQPARERTAPRARPRSRPQEATTPRKRPRTSGRPRLAGGVVWIGVFAALLAGVVFVNVSVLRLNVRLDRLESDRANLRGEIAALSSQISSTEASPLIQALARKRLGLYPAQGAETTYVDLHPHAR